MRQRPSTEPGPEEISDPGLDPAIPSETQTRIWSAPGTAVLLVASAVCTWSCLRLAWSPCRGQMLIGSPFGFLERRDFTDGCLRAMDSGPAVYFPAVPTQSSATEISWAAAAIALAGLAWFVFAVGRPVGRLTRLVAAVPGLVPITMSAQTWWTGRSGQAPDSGSAMALLLGAEVGMASAVILLIGRIPRSRRSVLGLLSVAWACGAFGLFHVIGDYLLMSSVSTSNWDYPPGSGVLTAISVLLGAVGALGPLLPGRRPPRSLRRLETWARKCWRSFQEPDPVS